MWKLAQDDLPALDKVCREELVEAQARERRGWTNPTGQQCSARRKQTAFCDEL